MRRGDSTSRTERGTIGSSTSWFERGVLIALVLGAVVGISPSTADPDLWGHVQYGRDLLRYGLPATTTYSYVAEGFPWINHEIVSEVLTAIVADTLGPHGLLWGKAALGGLLICFVMSHAAKRGAGMLTQAAIALLLATNLAYSWTLRPQLFSYMAYPALLGLLGWCFEGWEGRWQLRLPRALDRFLGIATTGSSVTPSDVNTPADPLHYNSFRMRFLWLSVPLFAVWTNAHGGFLAGYCVFVAYLGLRGLEALSHRGVRGLGLCLRFVLMISAAGVATFLNPYGPGFHEWLFEDLRVPRPEIVEWLPTSWFEQATIPLWLLVGTTLFSFAYARRSLDLTQTTILGLLFWQTCEHRRHSAFLAISACFWVAPYLEHALQRFRTSGQGYGPMKPNEAPSAALGMTRSMTLGLACVYLLLGYMLWQRLSKVDVRRDYYPIAAAEFIADNGLEGRMVCAFNWAQYMLYLFGARSSQERGLLIHVDGRCRTSYSQKALDEHFDFLFGEQPAGQRYRAASTPFNDAAVLKDGNPNLVLLDREQPHAEEVMKRHDADWALLFEDRKSQLWGKRDRYDDPRSPAYVPPEKRIRIDSPDLGSECWPALPSSLPKWNERVRLSGS